MVTTHTANENKTPCVPKWVYTVGYFVWLQEQIKGSSIIISLVGALRPMSAVVAACSVTGVQQMCHQKCECQSSREVRLEVDAHLNFASKEWPQTHDNFDRLLQESLG
jgi:hypothetical protein